MPVIFPNLLPELFFQSSQHVVFNTAETRPGHVFYPSCPRKEKAGLICQYVTMRLDHLWHQQLKSASNKICFWTSHLGGTFWQTLIWNSTSKTNSGNHHICEVCPCQVALGCKKKGSYSDFQFQFLRVKSRKLSGSGMTADMVWSYLSLYSFTSYKTVKSIYSIYIYWIYISILYIIYMRISIYIYVLALPAGVRSLDTFMNGSYNWILWHDILRLRCLAGCPSAHLSKQTLDEDPANATGSAENRKCWEKCNITKM